MSSESNNRYDANLSPVFQKNAEICDFTGNKTKSNLLVTSSQTFALRERNNNKSFASQHFLLQSTGMDETSVE